MRADPRSGPKLTRRCAIYTRVSTDSGLEQDFNSLDNQREASEAYIKSQAHEGWKLVRDRFDDGGFSGGSMERPVLQKLLEEIRARRIDVVVVYKVDRLTRSLADFAKLVDLFDAHEVSFISVTQSFNTTTSMGRLTLIMLLSFAQFEREITGERIRDKVAASKRKGIWMGGAVRLGYRVENRALHTSKRRLTSSGVCFGDISNSAAWSSSKPRWTPRPRLRRPALAKADGHRAGVRSRGGTCTGSCRTRSTSAGSVTRDRSTRDCMRLLSSAMFGIRFKSGFRRKPSPGGTHNRTCIHSWLASLMTTGEIGWAQATPARDRSASDTTSRARR